MFVGTYCGNRRRCCGDDVDSTPGTAKLPGTDPKIPKGYKKLSGKQPTSWITVSVIVRSRWWVQIPTDKEIFTLLTSKPLRERQHLSRAEYLRTYQADPKDVRAVKKWALNVGLKVEPDVTKDERERCCVMVSGTVAELSKAFEDAARRSYEKPSGGTGRLRTKPIFVPDDLAYVIEGVFGSLEPEARRQQTRKARLRGRGHLPRPRRPRSRRRISPRCTTSHAGTAGDRRSLSSSSPAATSPKTWQRISSCWTSNEIRIQSRPSR